MFKLPRLAVPILLALALSLGSCSCGDDDDDNDSTDGGTGGDDDDATDCGSADLLPGTWTAGGVTMEIADDLTYHTIGAAQTNYDVTGAIEVDGCTAMFTDLAGQGACPAAQVGEYAFVVTETTLTATLIDDPCAGRVFGLDGTVFERQP